MIGVHRRFSCLEMPTVDRHGSHCAVFGSKSTLRASRRPRPSTQARHQAKTCTACDQLLHDLHVVVVLVRRGARDRHFEMAHGHQDLPFPADVRPFVVRTQVCHILLLHLFQRVSCVCFRGDSHFQLPNTFSEPSRTSFRQLACFRHDSGLFRCLQCRRLRDVQLGNCHTHSRGPSHIGHAHVQVARLSIHCTKDLLFALVGDTFPSC